MKTPAFLFASLLVIAAFIAFELTSHPLSEAKSALADRQSMDCQPLPNDELDPVENTVYSPAFRAAWTLLVGDILGEPVRTVNHIPLVERLNEHLYYPKNVSDWVLEAGNVNEGIIEKIKQSLMYKFQETDPSLDKFRKEKDAIICYARMEKIMTFMHPFESLAWDFYHDEGMSRVACFGISKSKEGQDKKVMREQVSIYDYRNPDDFIVRLVTADPTMEIILAKMQPEATLQATFDRVNERMARSFPEGISSKDELMIPKVHLQTHTTISELIHQHLANKGFEEWFFAVASQQLHFSLDESGAVAKVTGKIVKIKGPSSRVYAFDRPFLLVCRKKGSKEPDIVAWVANPEVLSTVN